MKKLLLSSVAVLALSGTIYTQTVNALEVTRKHENGQVDVFKFETELEARHLANELGLVLTTNEDGELIFVEPTKEAVEDFKIIVYVDGEINQESNFEGVTYTTFLEHYTNLKEAKLAEGLQNIEDKFEGNTVKTYFANVEESTAELTPEVSGKVKYILNFETLDTKGTTEYEAYTAEEAEKYFRNYVNENGLGNLVWSFDSELNIFTATVEEAVNSTTEAEETTTEAEETTTVTKKEAAKPAALPNTGETTTLAGLALATLSVVVGAFLVSPRFKKEN